jgi:UDP-N-acetyl-D-glucosamine/UDP-N-acetyl-D-galactosamine dehydrogenase
MMGGVLLDRKIGVVGLGYVGLPVAIAFARKFPDVVGFDVNAKKVNDLRHGCDVTGEVNPDELSSTSLRITCDSNDLRDVNFYIVAVPTPIDKANCPDLSAVVGASETVGKVLCPGDVVVYESTVYPGVTEEVCGPVLAAASGLKQGVDFKLGYSPERINPGDKIHRLESIVKVVSGEDEATADIVAAVYGAIVDAGVFRAASIKVAEAAKVIENTQRDLNIALMNELAIIFDKMGIRTKDVLAAAGTKWNFLPFTPGLVGGHCIGVDPFYLTHKAEEIGYNPQVILAGRRINDGMGKFIAEQTVKHLAKEGKAIFNARVGIFGLTFKENVPDLRNSKVPDILAELREFGINALIHDPMADREAAMEEYSVELDDFAKMEDLDAVILTVAHREYVDQGLSGFVKKLKDGKGVIIDVKSVFDARDILTGVRYWSL